MKGKIIQMVWETGDNHPYLYVLTDEGEIYRKNTVDQWEPVDLPE